MSPSSDIRPLPASSAALALPRPCPARILLVDDDDELRSLMQAFLREEGYEVFACSNAARALEIANRRDDLDLLLTDMQMPGLSGLELARLWSARNTARPVVIISGASFSDSDLRLIIESGWRFVPKPFTVPRLLTVLAHALQIRQVRAA